MFGNKSTNYSLSNHVWYLKLILEVHQFHWLNIYKNNITFSYCQMSINKLVTNSCVVHQEHWLKIHLKYITCTLFINCWKHLTNLSVEFTKIIHSLFQNFKFLKLYYHLLVLLLQVRASVHVPMLLIYVAPSQKYLAVNL